MTVRTRADSSQISSPQSTAPTRAPTERRVPSFATLRRSWQAYALLAPIFILLIVFNYYPPVVGMVGAFFDWAPTSKQWIFVGLTNFRNYFAYPETVREILNIIKLLLYSLVVRVAIPFVMAELIFGVRSLVGKEAYRLVIVIPMLVPGVVYILLWQHIYDPSLGPLNTLLRAVGLDALALNWLGDPGTALFAIMGVGFPWVATVGTLVCLGGLAQISESVFDASLLDGCTGLRRVLLLDLPLVMGQLRMLTILAVVGAITSFESILVLTHGGPGYATMVPALTMYTRAFTTGQFGYASAIGLMLFVAAMALTVLISRSVRPFSEELGR